MSPLQDDTERPSAIVCIAYRQMSVMTGIKDPTEPKKVEETIQVKNQQSTDIIKASLTDFQIKSMQRLVDFSTEMAESFRLILEDLKARIEQFREQKQSMLDLLSPAKWTQREQ